MGAMSSERSHSRHGGYIILYVLLKYHPKFFPHVVMSINSFYECSDKLIFQVLYMYVGYLIICLLRYGTEFIHYWKI